MFVKFFASAPQAPQVAPFRDRSLSCDASRTRGRGPARIIKGGRVRGALAGLMAAAMAACGPRAAGPGLDVGAGSPPELGASLNVRVMDDSVRLEIHITNVASSPIVLEFATTQRYDFEVSDAGGERIWRWSSDQAFGEALGRESLSPGQSLRYATSWSGRGRRGDFIATARVVSGNYPVELRTGFRLPE
jgi:hypothetical protein